MVTDNASNMLLAAALAKVGLHVRYVAHLLNLASQKALKVEKVLELLVKVRKVSVLWRVGLPTKSYIVIHVPVLYNDKVYFIHSLTHFIHSLFMKIAAEVVNMDGDDEVRFRL